MPVQSFRVNVPANTPALNPVNITLKPLARFVREIVGPYCLTAGLNPATSGWRMFDRGGAMRLIPDTGSEDNAIQANPGEAGWAPLLPSAQKLKLDDLTLQGPPYEINLSFYNTSSGALVVAGFVRVVEPFAVVDESMIYEFATKGNPEREFFELQTPGRAALKMEEKRTERGKS